MHVPELSGRRAAGLTFAWFAFEAAAVVAQASFTSRWIAPALMGALFTGLGLLVWRHRPASWIGPLMVVSGLIAPALGWKAGHLPQPLPTISWIASGGLIYVPLTLLFLSLPHGRLTGRLDKWLFALVAVDVGPVWWAALPFWTRAACDDGCEADTNALALAPDQQTADLVLAVNDNLGILLALIVLGRVVYRYKRSTPPERHVAGPALIGAAVTLMAIVLAISTGAAGSGVAFALNHLAHAAIPIAFGITGLRTRVTRSTLGQLAVAIAGDPDPEHLEGHLARALGDPSARLAFPAGAGHVDASGRPVELPADARRTTQLDGAVLVHDPVLADDPGLVEAVGACASLALRNASLQAQVRAQLEEVQASRQRIAEAADSERRRIERDLHDGAQQRLLNLSLQLRLLQQETGSNPLAEEAADEAMRALRELRELARGIHPPVLTNDGLGPALESLAERSAVPVHVDAELATRLPAAVEGAAWFFACEGVANAVRHAHATQIWIRAALEDGSLLVEVTDDGVGGATVDGGLSGLRDRVEAVGGTFSVDAPPGVGTRLAARIPWGG